MCEAAPQKTSTVARLHTGNFKANSLLSDAWAKVSQVVSGRGAPLMTGKISGGGGFRLQFSIPKVLASLTFCLDSRIRYGFGCNLA